MGAFQRIVACIIISVFVCCPITIVHAETLDLPAPGKMVELSTPFTPALIKGLTLHPDDPLKFSFIIDSGSADLSAGPASASSRAKHLRAESEKLIKYFLAALTIPEKDLWVNLSPYEQDRIVPDGLGITALGRDLLAQDYVLKQLTASLIYPEKDLGREFWAKVYAKAREMYGPVEVPVSTFNKVWIVPQTAEVWEHGQSVFVVNSHLKVMLEQDYLAAQKNAASPLSSPNVSIPSNRVLPKVVGDLVPATAGFPIKTFGNDKGVQASQGNTSNASPNTSNVSSQIIRELILPQIEREVNEGRNFAPLRQVFNAMVLATWYKKNLRESLLGQVYANRNKTAGINLEEKGVKEEIYSRYLEAFKKGVYNYIKAPDTTDIANGGTLQKRLPRKYFSGGVNAVRMDEAMTVRKDAVAPETVAKHTGDINMIVWAARESKVPADAAMTFVGGPKTLLGATPQLGMDARQLADEIRKELAEPGTGKIPKIVTFSDEHGTIDKMDALVLDALRQVEAGKGISTSFVLDPDKSFSEQGIDLSTFKGQIFFHNLGDLMDRGAFGVKVYKRTRELVDAGISDFIIGNHDHWMYTNLLGLHLPFYEGFELYGYKDKYDTEIGGGDVRFLLKQHHADDPQTRKRSWWAHRLYEFRKFHEQQQKEYWVKYKNEVKGIDGEPGLFARMTMGMDEEAKKEWFATPAGEAWNKLRGHDANVGDVATGVEAVGLVSIVWWENLLKEFKTIFSAQSSRRSMKDTPQYFAWERAIKMMENEIIPQLRTTLEEHINPDNGAEPQWWWRIFEAINSQNYTSPEWWAMDWAYHNGWGPSVFKEINDTYYKGAQRVTAENYLDEGSTLEGVAILKEIAGFFKKNYALHIRDIFQHDYMHAFLPLTPEGEFYFNYRSRHYRGRGGNGYAPFWEGLEAIAQDVRNAPDDEHAIKSIYEAKTVVNGWYADNTTQAKVSHVAYALTHIGVNKIAKANGINVLSTGHLPIMDYLKLSEDKRRVITGHMIMSDSGQRGFVFTDGGMSPKFNGSAVYTIAGAEGYKLRGFEGKRAAAIVDNPRTIQYKKVGEGDEKERTVHYNDNPVPPDVFLPNVLQSITNGQLASVAGTAEGLLDENQGMGDAAMNGSKQDSSKWNQGGINLDAALLDLRTRKDGKGMLLPLPGKDWHTVSVNGFTPVIINIGPVNLPQLLE